MVQLKNWSHLGAITYASGARVSFDIPRWGPLLALRLWIEFTITNGATAAATPFHQALARIINGLVVKANGRDTLINMFGHSLASAAYIENGIVARGMDATVVLTGGAATTYRVQIPIWLCQPPRNAQRADDTGLDFRRGITGTLEVQFANSDCSDIYGTPNSAAISGVTCEVQGLYHLDAPADRQYRVRTLDQISVTLSASNSALQIPLDKGSGTFIRSLMVETLADKVGVNTIISNGMMSLDVGPTNIIKVKGDALKGIMQDDASFVPLVPQTGVYYMDAKLFGSAMTMIPTAGLKTDLVLTLDATKVSGTNTIIVTREGFRDLAAVG